MQARKLVAFLLLSLLGLAGCGAERTFPPPVPSPDLGWSMQLVQTGGFAGVNLIIRVTSAGDGEAHDLRTGRAAPLRLSAGELAELDNLRRTLPAQQTTLRPSACADCFTYELEVVSKARTIRVQADDTALSASGAQTLIDYLRELRDRALSGAS